jgi:hypothetical protein
MRDLKRNTQKVFYKLYLGEQSVIDQYGNVTGSYIPVYSDLMEAEMVVSPNKGAAETEQFGSLLDYDRTMTTADVNVLIDESSVLWVDGADTAGAWNYEVKKRAPWKNSVQFAISQVNVSVFEEYQKKVRDAALMSEVIPNVEA